MAIVIGWVNAPELIHDYCPPRITFGTFSFFCSAAIRPLDCRSVRAPDSEGIAAEVMGCIEGEDIECTYFMKIVCHPKKRQSSPNAFPT